jgi:GntR family histidine utilization transcriptional repressor
MNHVPAEPRYLSVKQMITGRIYSGQWPPRHKIPSESALVEEFQVSRMTVNRALRELSLEGLITRMQGIGSFVAEPKLTSSVLEVQNVADEIIARGGSHAAAIIQLRTITATPLIAQKLQIPAESTAFHSLIVHHENNLPLQIEDRYVNPALAPDYAKQDFNLLTPNQYLSAIIPWTKAEHQVEATLPTPAEAELLGISPADPCLLIHRRTFAGPLVVTYVRLTFPGSRYRIESQQILGGLGK